MVKTYIIISLVFFSWCPLIAQEKKDAKDVGYFDDEKSNARIPNRSLPTSFHKKFNLNFSDEDLEFFIDTSAKTTFSDSKNTTDLRLRLATKWDNLDANLKLNLMDALNQSYINNGLTQQPTKELLEKLWISWEAFKIEGSQGTWLALSLQAGRNAASPLGIFILPYRANLSILDAQKIDQVDYVSVNTTVMENTIVEVVAFGFDWFGYDASSISQKGKGSAAVNILHSIDTRGSVFNLYLSFAATREGFINPNRPISADDQLVVAKGVEYVQQNLTVSLETVETYNKDFKEFETAVSIQVAYDISDSSMTVFAAAEYFNSQFKSESGKTFSIGAKWKILENVYIIVEGSEIFRKNDDDDFIFYMGVLVDSNN